MKQFKLLLFITIILLSFNGCRTVTPYNIENKPLSNQNNLDTTTSYIHKACHSLGWKTKQMTDNMIFATHSRGKVSASIKIRYSKKAYDISLVNAINFNYNTSSNTIHRRYNNWIKNLEHTIDSYTKP